MTEYFWPLMGGLIIGLSAAFLLVFLGRIAGISGIFWGAFKPSGISALLGEERSWRLFFILGLPLGAFLVSLFMPVPSDQGAEGGVFTLVLAGLLVGFGTNMGSGCTSGHGVCGVGRASPRSVVATLVFMSAGILTVLLVRHGGMA